MNTTIASPRGNSLTMFRQQLHIQVMHVFDHIIPELLNDHQHHERVKIALKWNIFDNHDFITAIVERILSGCNNDIIYFLSQAFHDYPYGLQQVIIGHMISIHDRYEKEKYRKYTRKSIAPVSRTANNIGYDIIAKWRKGLISPLQIYAFVSKAVQDGQMNDETAQAIITTTLEEGGHHHIKAMQSSSSITLSHRKRYHIEDISLLDIISIHASSSHDAMMIITNNIIVNLELTNHRLSHNIDVMKRTKDINYASSSTSLLWQHVGQLDHLSSSDQQLIIVHRQPSSSSSSSYPSSSPYSSSSSSSSYPSSSYDHPLLLIGDRVIHDHMILDIDEVISVDVDVHRYDDKNTITRFSSIAILVSGHISHHQPSSSSSSSDYVDPIIYDGATDPGDADDHIINHSPSGAGDDGNHPLSIPYIIHMKTRYYIIFASIVDDIIIIRSIISDTDTVMLLDQHPVAMKMISSYLAIIYGSNGLLCLAIDPSSSSSGMNEMQHDIIPIAIDPKSHRYFLDDDHHRRSSYQRSHSYDATILCISSSAASASCYHLTSADDQGMICLWHINIMTRHASLVADPIFPQPLTRINNLIIAPNHRQVVACYNDRLLLIGLNTDANPIDTSSSTSSSLPSASYLHVRSVLDIVEGYRAIYTVSFTSSSSSSSSLPSSSSCDIIRIYRIMNSVRVNEPSSSSSSSMIQGITISTWHHMIPDEFEYDTRYATNFISEYDDNEPVPHQHNHDAVDRTTYPQLLSISLPSSPTLTSPRQTHSIADMNIISPSSSSHHHHHSMRVTSPPSSSPSYHMMQRHHLMSTPILSPSAIASPVIAVMNPHASSSSSTMLIATRHHEQMYSERESTPNLTVEGTPSYPPQHHHGDDDQHHDMIPSDLPSHASSSYISDNHHDMHHSNLCGLFSVIPPTTVSLSNHHHRPSSTPMMSYHDCDADHLDHVFDKQASIISSSSSSMIIPSSIESSSQPTIIIIGPVRRHDHHIADYHHRFLSLMQNLFIHDLSATYLRVKLFLTVYCAIYRLPSIGLISAALDTDPASTLYLIESTPLHDIFDLSSISLPSSNDDELKLHDGLSNLKAWMISTSSTRIGQEFWLDVMIGHNYLCALHLRYCGNKSVAMESVWQEYLRIYGPTHLRHTSRSLRDLTQTIRKIDETVGIKDSIPPQIGYISGLQEIYARRVGLRGCLPTELGELSQLRVLSMGNNRLCGQLPSSLGHLTKLQRIVLHQNCLTGHVPDALGRLGCIVNLAGNLGLDPGPEVPSSQREALIDFYNSTSGRRWNTKTNWLSSLPVCNWYKVGVLSSNVHSIVMSSNGMDGRLPSSIGKLSQLRMIELATMPGLVGPIPTQLCSIITLRRLCICRCGLSGSIPDEIGRLTSLEELQLFGNSLTGFIPSSLGNLKELKLLSLGEYTGGNAFTSAPLPFCLSKLKNLEALFMANCNLKGSLPFWIAELTELRQLDLQRNNLSGALPDSIGNLTNLLYLNLKDNESLTGHLPVYQMASLTKLNRLSLVHCNFTNAEVAVEVLQAHLPRCKIWI